MSTVWRPRMGPPEFLARNEVLAGYIFICNNETMRDCLRLRIFGLRYRYRDSVSAIRPATHLFLYNYNTGLLYGGFESTSSGGININPSAWPDANYPGRSRYPAQVRVRLRDTWPALPEWRFRPLVQHFRGRRFRLELTQPEVITLVATFMCVHTHCDELRRGIAGISALLLECLVLP